MSEPLLFNACGYSTNNGLRSAAGWFSEKLPGNRVTGGLLSHRGLNGLLGQLRPGEFGAYPGYPGPGLFIQASTGWFYVLADERIEPTTARLFDAFTGAFITVRDLEC